MPVWQRTTSISLLCCRLLFQLTTTAGSQGTERGKTKLCYQMPGLLLEEDIQIQKLCIPMNWQDIWTISTDQCRTWPWWPRINWFQLAKPGLNAWDLITSKTTESQSALEINSSLRLHEQPIIFNLAADVSCHRITILPKLYILTLEELMLIKPSQVQERSVPSFSRMRGDIWGKPKTKQWTIENWSVPSDLQHTDWEEL